jgi:calcineurin-like phosphoesterase family protein
MSKDIWVISDTHLSHENILKFTDSDTGDLIRGHLFDNVDQMDEFILEKWNSTIKEGDIVYHLGYVFIGRKERFERQ